MTENKCCGYYRLSKEDMLKGKDESASIENQRMIVESFCNYHGLIIEKEYIDDGFSGGNFERPGFQEMIKDIETKRINCVITKDLSRLGRELYQTGSYIEDYFTSKGIRYIAINDGFDSLNGDSMLSMKLTFNDYILRDTSRKIKIVFNAKQKKGDYIGSYPKYGYQKDPENSHHLIIDPVASIIVKRIFSLALAGESPYKIAQILTLDKIPIPIVYKKEPRGLLVTENEGYGIWRQQTIRDILTSEMYIGNMEQNIYKKLRYNSKKLIKTKKEDHIIVENTHEPIINKETFTKVGNILETRSKSKINYSKKSEEHIFLGLLYCKDCGGHISIQKRELKSKTTYFTRCNNYAKRGKYSSCQNHRVNYSLLEEDLLYILREVCNIILKEYDNNKLIEDVSRILNKELEIIQKNIDNLKKEIQKIQNVIEQLYNDKSEGNLSVVTFKNLLKKNNDSLNLLIQERDNLEKKKIVSNSKLKKLNYNACEKIVRSFIETSRPSYALISELIDKVEISNDKKITIHFKFQKLTYFIS